MAVNLTANYRAIVYEFIKEYAVPSVDPNNIIFGQQSFITLPQSDDYIVFTPLYSVRHGRGEEVDDPENGKTYLRETIEVPVQIDCYANSQNNSDGMDAFLRAQALETVARSVAGVRFFKERGISLLYAEGVENITGVDESNRFIKRWTVTIHLSLRSIIEIPEYFTDGFELNVNNIP